MMAAEDIERAIEQIDRDTQGFCVYPQGYNADCQDCGICREQFLTKIREILTGGGSARLLVIEEGKINGDL